MAYGKKIVVIECATDNKSFLIVPITRGFRIFMYKKKKREKIKKETTPRRVVAHIRIPERYITTLVLYTDVYIYI